MILKEKKIKRKPVLAARTAIPCLLTMVFLISCVGTSPMQKRAVTPEDPYRLTIKYLEDLKHGNDNERTEAAWKLGEPWMKRTPEVVPALIGALRDFCPKVRANAAGALSRMGEDARPAENALKEVLDDPYGQTVLNAAIALRSLNIIDKELIPAVRKVLHDQKGTSRVGAVSLLRKMGIQSRETFSVLVSALSDPAAEARKDALKEIIEMKLKPVPKEMVGPVIGLLKDSDEGIRCDAAIFLGNSHIPIIEAKDPLIEALNDSSDTVVGFVARALGVYGPSAKDAVPKLFRILNTTRDEHTKVNICEALGRIGSPKEKIADVLVGFLSSDPNSRTRVAAACALRDLKYNEKGVMDALKKASTQDPDPSVRALSSVALKQLEGKK